MNAHALPLQQVKYAPPKTYCLRLRLLRPRTVEILEAQRPAPDMTWALYRLAPRV